MQIKLKHFFWPIIDCSSVYATGDTHCQGVALGHIGWRCQFCSCHEDGGHIIRSTMAENPLLYANSTSFPDCSI